MMPSVGTALNIALVLTLAGVTAGSLRMVLGPSRADRVVALDLVTVLLVAMTSLLAMRFDNAAYLDLGLALALVGFLATVAFARYVEREHDATRGKDLDPEHPGTRLSQPASEPAADSSGEGSR